MYLDGDFSAAGLMMASALSGLDDRPLVQRFPSLAAYRDRCTVRRAFARSKRSS